jgi:hypothetical protein
MSDEPQISDNPAAARLELVIDGQLAELTYRIRAGRMVITHTGVPESLQHRGLGGRLVRAAVEKAAAGQLTVVPLCPFARTWLQLNKKAAATVTVDWGNSPVA